MLIEGPPAASTTDVHPHAVQDAAFVIVDQGNLVNDIVMAPQPNLVTAVLRRVGD